VPEVIELVLKGIGVLIAGWCLPFYKLVLVADWCLLSCRLELVVDLGSGWFLPVGVGKEKGVAASF
jgi:hypothetical protein